MTRSIGIMQPYFLPYIGYFQLIASVDEFIIYDNIKYTKKGWINRNRLLQKGKGVAFTLPLLKASDSLNVVDRRLAEAYDRKKLLNKIRGYYSNAPHYASVFPLVERIVAYDDNNLFRYIYNSVVEICTYLSITTDITVSSEVDIDQNLKSQDRVLALCKARGALTYINPSGGMDLYHPRAFQMEGMQLKFIKSHPLEYEQFGAKFVPWLSIVDVLMFNSQSKVEDMVINGYELA